MSGFQWQTTPDAAFGALMADYQRRIFERLYAIMVEEAPNVERFMRQNARWKDDCMPGREYLRAFAWRDDEALQVGITAYYDLALYRQNCPEPEWDWGTAHETKFFKWVGKISVILPGDNPSVLVDEAQRIWQRIQAEFNV